MKQTNEDDLRLAAQAARWQHTLQHADESTLAQFCAWVKTSPRHLQEFLFMEALDAASVGLDPERKIDIDAQVTKVNVLRLAPQLTSGAALPPRATEKERARGKKGLMWGAAAGIAIAALMLLLSIETASDWQSYTTEVGEQRAVELEDGSVIQLNTQSRVQAKLTERGRDIRLLEGEALFKVAQDATRPFRVHAGETVIRAVGTQFNVNRRAAATTVAVLEGRVQVEKQKAAAAAPQILDAGQGASIANNGKVTRKTLNVAEVAAWRQRRLVFREETLSAIAAEFNRYNRSPQIVVDDTAGAERFGGTFDADDPESFAQFVGAREKLSVTREPGRIVIQAD